MLTSFALKNFRCFGDLKLDDLDRVNLIAGRNNVGKTALLEAIHLHCLSDDPIGWVQIHRLRGVERPLRITKALGSWLFCREHNDSPVETMSRDTHGVERSTDFHLVDPATSRNEFPEVEESIVKSVRADIAGSEVPRLILRSRSGGKEWDSVTLPHPSGHVSLNAPVSAKISTVFLGSQTSDRRRDVTHFGELESAKRLDEVTSSLRILEPRLRRLSLVPFTRGVEIHGEIEGVSRLVPLPLIGEGMRRLLSMVLAIANVPGGIVLVDEIEKGLHYSVLPRIWKAVADAARRNDVQVFAATHSWECLRAAHETFSQDDLYDFRYYRLDRTDEEVTCVPYDRELIEASLTMGMEVR